MASSSLTRQRSVSNRQEAPQIVLPKGKDAATDTPFEPCAATASHFLFAQGPTVLVLAHDTLALERRFQSHHENISLISCDNVSERGAGRLVVTYDVGKTAIIWDLFTGEQISRFSSYEPLLVAAWMRNGNIAFGKMRENVPRSSLVADKRPQQETKRAMSSSLSLRRANTFRREQYLTPSPPSRLLPTARRMPLVTVMGQSCWPPCSHNLRYCTP